MDTKKTLLPVLTLNIFLILFALVLYKNIDNSFELKSEALKQWLGYTINEIFFKTRFNTNGLTELAKELKKRMPVSTEELPGPTIEKLRKIFSDYGDCIKEVKQRFTEHTPRILAEFGISTSLFYLYEGNTIYKLITEKSGNKQILLLGNLKDLRPEFLRGYFHHKDKDMNYYFRINFYVKILNHSAVILRQAAGIILFSILGFLAAFSFVIYISRIILQQKKISDMKDDFISNMTHELNTPLSTIDVAVQTIQKSKGSMINDPLIKTIKRQNDRLKMMINKIMDLSFYKKEGLFLNPSTRSINHLLANILKDFRIKNKDIQFSLKSNFLADPDQIFIDPFHFETVIHNLLDNSLKYCRETPEINISTQNLGNFLTIKITDNGIGINPRYRKNIFNKFFRIKTKDVKQKTGLGLGLYMAKKIIIAHQGKLDFKNNPEGGCSFIIQLPLKKSEVS